MYDKLNGINNKLAHRSRGWSESKIRASAVWFSGEEGSVMVSLSFRTFAGSLCVPSLPESLPQSLPA